MSSTEPASASNSRDRDSASLTTCDNSHASRISATAMMIAMTAPPPPLLSRSDEDDDDERDGEDQPLPEDEFHDRLVNMRKNNSPKKPTTPAMIIATTISCTSPLRMWVSSWPSTASISASSSACNSPVVTVMEYCRGLRPVANAFSAGLSISFSLGIAMPREMQRFSNRLYSRGCYCRVTPSPPVTASIMFW